jgi:hypothetical protein
MSKSLLYYPFFDNSVRVVRFSGRSQYLGECVSSEARRIIIKLRSKKKKSEATERIGI